MNKISKFASTALITLFGTGLALPAHAVPTLRLTKGANVVIVKDTRTS